MKFGLSLLTLAFAATFGSTGLFGTVGLVAAPSSLLAATKPTPKTTPSSRRDKRTFVVLPQLPPGSAPGGRRYGGATRGQCPNATPPLTALVPSTPDSSSVTNVWGLTAKEYPKLWFYLPYTKNSSTQAEFTVLDDESKDPIYTSAIALPTKPSTIAVSLPHNIPPLQVGKKYRWFLNVYCDPQKQSVPIFVEGVIIRKKPDAALVKELQKAQPLQQVAIYAGNGFWHDALTTVAELRQKSPQNEIFEKEWTNLLQAIGLGDVANKPLASN